MTVDFMCECEPFKIDWLLQAFPDTLLFNDMRDLSTGRAFDAKSKNWVSVPKARGWKKPIACTISKYHFVK